MNFSAPSSYYRRNLVIVALSCLTISGLQAEQSEIPPTRAIDAKGVRHLSSEYPGKPPPWMADITDWVAPEYSPRDRMSRNQGTGVFRLTLDERTGAVINVTIVKSIGITTLNQSAIASLRQWRWKPARWKEVDIPVTFTTTGPVRLPPGAVRIPSR
jgi:TonB family protein